MRFIYVSLLLCGCSDYNLSTNKYAESPREIGPCITVSPSTLDFGQVLVGEQSTETVTIANVCVPGDDTMTLDLEVLSTAFDGDDSVVFDLTALETDLLADGEEVELAVTFAPEEVAEYETDLVIESNDTTDAAVVVFTLGEGVEEITDDTEDPVSEGDEPIADAGPDQEVAPLDSVLLDGTDSYDPGGNEPLTYRWAFVDTPSGSGASLSDATDSRPRFTPDLAGTYELELSVTNSVGVADPTPDTVIIDAVPTKSFYVQLTWDTTMDLDLHLLDGSGPIFNDPGDVCYCNLNPNWGTGAAYDDPSLDIDAIYGYGPETTTIEIPADGSYQVQVHFYGENGADTCSGRCDPSEATVDLYMDGVLTDSWTETLTDQGDVWEVFTLDYPDETITDDNNMTSTTRTYCY